MPPEPQYQRDQILSGIGQANTAIARLEATLEAHLKRTRDEVDALFKVRSDHEQRLAMIERSYVPETDCGRTIADFNKRLTITEGNVTNVRLKLAMIFGVAVVVSSLANWLIPALIKFYAT